jgi:hypothetical protein
MKQLVKACAIIAGLWIGSWVLNRWMQTLTTKDAVGLMLGVVAYGGWWLHEDHMRALNSIRADLAAIRGDFQQFDTRHHLSD